MATVSGIGYNPVLTKSYKAVADYRAVNTNVFVYLTADGVVTRSTANTKAIGIMVNNPNINEQAEVIVLGTAPLRCGTAITINDWIKSDAVGEADQADTDLDNICARALIGGAHDDIIEVELVKGTLNIS